MVHWVEFRKKIVRSNKLKLSRLNLWIWSKPTQNTLLSIQFKVLFVFCLLVLTPGEESSWKEGRSQKAKVGWLFKVDRISLIHSFFHSQLNLQNPNFLSSNCLILRDTGTGMGQAFRKLFDTFFGNTEMRVTFCLLVKR